VDCVGAREQSAHGHFQNAGVKVEGPVDTRPS
jgi:hypothetical protein